MGPRVRIQGLGSRVWGSGFRVWGLGIGVEGLGFRVNTVPGLGVHAGSVAHSAVGHLAWKLGLAECRGQV